MSIAENIKRLRAMSGLTQEEFGKIADVSSMAVSQWENGRAVPRMGAIQRLSDHFGIPKGDLIEDERAADIPGARRVISGGRATVPLRSMKRAGWVHAGDPTDEPDSDGEVMVPEDVAIAHPNAFALRVEGDCMDRVITEGSDVIVDPCVEPHTRSVVVVRLEETGEVVMRRLVGSRQTMVLEADSHTEHDDLVFPADGGAVKLIGVVVWSQRSI